MRIGLNGPQDVLVLVVRRKWWIIAPFVALSCAAGVLTYILPKTFVSETLILVRPRDVPQDFVKDLIAGSPEERLKAIEQTILSRTNLIQIQREFGDRLPEFERLNMDQKVLKLRDQIKIDFALEKGNEKGLPLTYFRISYQNQNPELAQKIAGKLTTLFIEQDNLARETQVFGTTEFLSSELDKVSEQLRESETKLKSIKTSRQFELPDQREANLRTLDRLGVEKKTNAEALDRYATIRLNLETEISQTPPTMPKTIPFAGPVSTKPWVSTKVEEYLKAQQEYEEIAGKYTPKHPEFQAAKARLERLKQHLPAEVLAAASLQETADNVTPAPNNANKEVEPNPLYQKLLAQLQEVKTEFEIRNRDKAWIESEIAKYSQRVENTPNAEQDIAGALRQNEDLKKRYDDLRDKLAQARLAESLESKQKGSQFVIVDPANYPLTPTKPQKQLVFLGGVAISLLLSVSFVVAFHIARQRIWTQSEVEALWGVPVLVDIPEILTDSDLAVRRRKQFLYAGCSAVGGLVWSFCLYIVYHKQALVLQQLEPVLQKLVYK